MYIKLFSLKSLTLRYFCYLHCVFILHSLWLQTDLWRSVGKDEKGWEIFLRGQWVPVAGSTELGTGTYSPVQKRSPWSNEKKNTEFRLLYTAWNVRHLREGDQEPKVCPLSPQLSQLLEQGKWGLLVGAGRVLRKEADWRDDSEADGGVTEEEGFEYIFAWKMCQFKEKKLYPAEKKEIFTFFKISCQNREPFLAWQYL